MIRRLRNHFRIKKGQSFVELAVILLVLALVLAGVVEFGFLMNNYLHVFDGGREAARFSANSVAIDNDGNNIPEFYTRTAQQALRVMHPIRLHGAKTDDILISVFSVAGGSVARYPSAGGWSLCAHAADPILAGDLGGTDWTGCAPRATNFTNAQIAARLDAAAPPAGYLLVEVFYNYDQILELPLFSDFLDPIPVYAYSVMPLSSAEPTPTPRD